MGIVVQNNNQRSKLQDRITADLREKAQATSRDIDFAEDSEYTKNLKKTGRFSWVWFVLILFAVLALVVILVI